MQSKLLILISAVCLSTTAYSEDNEEPASPWSGNASLGYTSVSGNTETESLVALLDVFYDQDKWHHSLLASAINSSQTDETTAEAYKVAWQTKYDISAVTYLYGLVDWNKDRFSSYDYQIFENAGIGRRFIDTDTHKLNGEIGAGFRQAELQDGTSESGVTGRIAGDYTWIISENASFHQALSASPASENTYIESITELKAGIIGNIAMSLAYIVKHNTEVLPGTEKTDTFTAISLEYSF